MFQLQQIWTHSKKIQLKKKERETKKYDEEGHITKNCERKQLMKKCKVQEESDDKDDKK